MVKAIRKCFCGKHAVGDGGQYSIPDMSKGITAWTTHSPSACVVPIYLKQNEYLDGKD